MPAQVHAAEVSSTVWAPCVSSVTQCAMSHAFVQGWSIDLYLRNLDPLPLSYGVLASCTKHADEPCMLAKMHAAEASSALRALCVGLITWCMMLHPNPETACWQCGNLHMKARDKRINELGSLATTHAADYRPRQANTSYSFAQDKT